MESLLQTSETIQQLRDNQARIKDSLLKRLEDLYNQQKNLLTEIQLIEDELTPKRNGVAGDVIALLRKNGPMLGQDIMDALGLKNEPRNILQPLVKMNELTKSGERQHTKYSIK